MDTNTISLMVSISAVVVSIIALWSQRTSESRALRISFLLPELAEIITTLRSMKVKELVNGRPDDESMQEFYAQAKDICFRKEHVLRSIGLGKQVEILINAKGRSAQEIHKAFIELFEGLDTRYQKLIGVV